MPDPGRVLGASAICTVAERCAAVWRVSDDAKAPSRGEGWLGFPEIVQRTILPNHGRSPEQALPGPLAGRDGLRDGFR